VNRGIILAWAAGLGLVSWREIKTHHMPPVPGKLLAASGLYALLALVAAYQPAAGAASLAAWGFDLALILKPGVLPSFAGGGATGTTQAPGTHSAAGRG
jgi:hypothetical protein